MTTCLFWKSLEISNKFYNLILKYTPPLSWDPKTELAVVRKCYNIPFRVYLLILMIVLLSSLNVVRAGWQSVSCSVPIFVVLVNFFLVAIISLCLALIIVLYPNLNIAFEQYYNSLIQYERKIYHRKMFAATQLSLVSILKMGEFFSTDSQ